MLDRIFYYLCVYVRCIDLLDFIIFYEFDCIVDFVFVEFFLCILIYCMYILISYNFILFFEKIDGFFGLSFLVLYEYLIIIMYICFRFDENLLKS